MDCQMYRNLYYSDAINKLKELGIVYDRIYRTIFKEISILRCTICVTVGDNYYFNNGHGLNVAYYNRETQVLVVFDKPRIDGTPEEKRKYK